MFTGLIEEVGIVKGVRKSGDGILLEINAVQVIEGTKIGDSIAINGACQTVTAVSGTSFTVYASQVTTSLTTLGNFKVGKKANLERAMSPQSRFGGHFVQGHVDGIGMVKQISRDTVGMSVIIVAEPALMKYIVHRGSLAVDGISLTVVSVSGNDFVLYLIPETLKNTIIPGWLTGDIVNIEVDIIAKYIERMLEYTSSENTKSKDESLKKKLFEEGFI